MPAALADLVRTNPCAFSLISAMGRNYPLCRNVSRSRAQTILQAEGENFPLDQVVEALRSMSQAGLGGLRWNDAAEEFNFAWSLTPATVLESLRSGQSLDALTAEFKPAGEDDFDTEIEEPLCKHRFQLRRDCVIGLELPENLTKREARKIFKYLRALAFRVPTWPFPTSSKLDELEDGLDSFSRPKGKFSEDDFPEEESDDFDVEADNKAENLLDSADDDDFYDDPIDQQSSSELSAKKTEKSKVDWDKF